MKILVADDDCVSLRMMQRMLQRSGYDVCIAENGRDAADQLCAPGGPRLALIDWMMPQLDGPGVCREVRNRNEGCYVYILLLTAKQSSDGVVVGLEAGADDYLTKPCHPAELEARLRTGQRILHLEDKLVDAREEMRFKATHDGLTTLWNRTAILALLKSELSRAVRDRSPLSLLLVDIDHFKHVNDQFGHQVGDEVLQEVSVRLLDSVRSHDAVGRYGGEEFLILLSGCDRENFKMRAEQVRRRIGDSPVATGAGPVAVSMSAGGITIEHWDRTVTPETFLKRADDALYRAKADGRDRVVYADALVMV